MGLKQELDEFFIRKNMKDKIDAIIKYDLKELEERGIIKKKKE